MTAICWLRLVDVLGAHKRQIAMDGGTDGVRDQGLLESALARPKNIAAYEDNPSLHRLAAAYAYGIANNHPFVDGNKRTALVAMELFLDLHDVAVNATEDEKYVMMIQVASGGMSEEDLASWLDTHCGVR